MAARSVDRQFYFVLF